MKEVCMVKKEIDPMKNIIDRAQRFHQSEIRNLTSQIIILDVIGIKSGFAVKY